MDSFNPFSFSLLQFVSYVPCPSLHTIAPRVLVAHTHHISVLFTVQSLCPSPVGGDVKACAILCSMLCCALTTCSREFPFHRAYVSLKFSAEALISPKASQSIKVVFSDFFLYQDLQWVNLKGLSIMKKSCIL